MTTSSSLRRGIGLIMDDDPLYARTLRRSLSKRGFEFLVASNFEEALSLASAPDLDFAIIDMHLGARSGLELIGPLREAHPAMSIVLLAAHGTLESTQKAIERGADYCLLKPVSVDTLLHAFSHRGGSC